MQYGDLVAIEGTDGSGKTTTLNILKKMMDRVSWRYLMTRDPAVFIKSQTDENSTGPAILDYPGRSSQ